MSARTILFYLVLFSTAMAQGFAGLGTDAEGFDVPEPGVELRFPQDHGPHPNFRIEWWYVTANLSDGTGRDYGMQWTLFRAALKPGEAEGWSSPQVWMGHAAVTTKDQHLFAERLARGGIGQAGVKVEPFEAWIDDWNIASSTTPDTDELSSLTLRAAGQNFAYDLKLDAKGPLVLHGDRGYSVKSLKGHASYYYSQPFYDVSGTLKLPGGDVAVSGKAWLDREWSSQPLSGDQTGWDWFAFHLDTGEKLMGYRFRDGGDDFTAATWIAADGTAEPQAANALRVTPLETVEVAGREIPVRWRVELPGKHLDITTRVLNQQAWMATRPPYWEGPVRIEGSHQGRGYIEMTGYK